MTKIIAFSDSHGNKTTLSGLQEEFINCDNIFFCGDGLSDLADLPDSIKDKITAVRGNCDFFSQQAYSAVKRIESVNFFITHGHTYGVKSSLEELCSHAKAIGVNVAVFGHTHLPVIKKHGGITLINPGSLAYPRGGVPSYAQITVDGSKVNAQIVYLE